VGLKNVIILGSGRSGSSMVAGLFTIDTSRSYMVSKRIGIHPFLQSIAVKLDDITGRTGIRVFDSVAQRLSSLLLISPHMNSADYKWLLNIYHDDIRLLESLLKRSLAGWLDPECRKARSIFLKDAQ
jgi:hypothetical protein